MAEIIKIPFNEANGATTAADESGNGHNAALTNVTFLTTGKSGNCAHFDGTALADIDEDVLTLSGDFTIMAWVNPALLSDGFTGAQMGLFCNTAELEGSNAIWVDVLPDTWGFVAIIKDGDTVSLYLDTVLQGSITLPATLTGISLIQNIYSTGYAVADLDTVEIFDTVLTEEEIAERLNAVTGEIDYYLEGVNLQDYGIRVSSSEGVIDRPSLKAPPEVVNDNYHGRMLDLSAPRYEERVITLHCWLKASGKNDFIAKVRSLYDLLDEAGTQRLMIDLHPVKPLVYEVYCRDGVAHDKKWHDDLMIGTFDLVLREPDPVKIVARVRSISGTEVTVSFKCDKLTTVSWGDGSERETTHGESVLTHTYDTSGIFYVIIGGVIEEITDLQITNGSIVWQRL